jgi:hypothetical protein
MWRELSPATELSSQNVVALILGGFSFLVLLMPDLFQGAGMNTPQKAVSAYLLKTLVDKLRPEKFPGMPPVVAALPGFVLRSTVLRSVHCRGRGDIGRPRARQGTRRDCREARAWPLCRLVANLAAPCFRCRT